MVDDLLPPDFNKPPKRKKKRDVPSDAAAPDAETGDIPAAPEGETEAADWDLSGESILDYIEPEPAVKSKAKGSKAKKEKKETEPAPSEEIVQESEELPDLGSSEWDVEVPKEEAPSTEETATEWESPEFEAPEFEAPEYEAPAVSDVQPEEEPEWGEAPPEVDSEWAETPDWNSEETTEESSLGADLEAAWSNEAETTTDQTSDMAEAAASAEEIPLAASESHEDVFEIPEQKKPGFLSTSQGKAAILGGIVLIVAILVAIPMIFMKGGEEQAGSTTTTLSGGPDQTTSTVPVITPDDEETTTTSIPIIVIEATKDVFSLPNVEFRDPFTDFETATADSSSVDVRLNPSSTVLTLRLITRDAGRNVAIIDYQGATYSVEENEVVDNSFYEVKTIGNDYVKMLYGDDVVLVRVGESDVR